MKRPPKGGRPARPRGKPGVKEPFQRKRKPEDREARLVKWQHHCLKAIQKELKKARTFETRKILRRLKEAKEAVAQPTEGKPTLATDSSKLQVQLDALKSVNLEVLAKKVAAKAHLLCDGGPQSQEAPGSPVPTPSPPEQEQAEPATHLTASEVVEQRMCRAACVRRQVETFQAGFNKLFGRKQAGKKQTHGEQGGTGQASSDPGGQPQLEESDPGSEPDVSEPGDDEQDQQAGDAHRLLHKLHSSRLTRLKGKQAAGDSSGGDDDGSDEAVCSDSGGDSGVLSGSEDQLDSSEPGSDADLGSAGTASGDDVDGEGDDDEDSDAGSEGSFNSEDFDLEAGAPAGVQPASKAAKQAVLSGTAKDASGTGSTGKKAGERGDKKAGERVDKKAGERGDKRKAGLSEKQQRREQELAVKYARAHDPLLAQSKNRMGQKARRALYEKMYGARANHIVKQRQDTQRRAPAGKGTRQVGAVGKGHEAGRQQLNSKSSRATVAGDASKRPITASTDAVAQPEQLHPSWAARKAAKQRLHISAEAPAPKKIKFSDDGGVQEVIPAAARAANTDGRAGGRAAPPNGRLKAQSQTASQQQGHVRVQADEPGLHPSWAAKQKQRQQQVLASTKGTKIVFDD